MADKYDPYAYHTDEEQPANGLPLRRVEPKSLWQDKRLWAVAGVFLFFGGAGGLVPAGKSPFLSKVVQAMGCSAQEAEEMSLLKALLRQNQRRREEKPRALSPEEIAAAAQRYTDRARAEAQESAAKYVAGKDVRKLPSALISMRALAAAQRRNGQREDRVSGAYTEVPGTEKDQDRAVRVNNVDAPLATQAAEAGSGAVLFGVDASTTVREEHDGFNSTKILTKIQNPHIAGSTTTSWLTQTMDRAVSTDANLGQLNKGLNMVGNYTNFEDIKTIGNDRPHRDLYYAWLTGKTTYRTPNPMLKKTLAAAGFNGEEMPRRVFDSSLNGTGLGIDPNDVASDAKSIRDRMEKDKTCQAQLLAGNDSNSKAYASMKKSVGSVGASFPQTCAADSCGTRVASTGFPPAASSDMIAASWPGVLPAP